MKVSLLKEPLLEFGGDNLCDDPKMGISNGGFFSLSNNSHRSEIHFGVIGSNQLIELACKWIDNLDSYIIPDTKEIKSTSYKFVRIEHGEVQENELDLDAEFYKTEEIEETHEVQNQNANPAFPGFNMDSCFRSKFVNDSTNNVSIKNADLQDILNNTDLTLLEKSFAVCDLYLEAYQGLLTRAIVKPGICLIVLPDDVYDKLHSIPLGKGRFFNLRRYLKSRLIILPNAIPVQIMLEGTVAETRSGLQDMSMQAWNFVTASYYKNLGAPWTLGLDDKDTCFIGISFHKVINSENNLVRSSIAQAFNYEGKGIVFIGNKFEWDSEEMNTKSPHLSYSYARELINAVLKEYKDFHRGLPPARVVIHKTTNYWNSAIHKEYAEVEGFKDGIKEALGDYVEIDLVTIKQANIRLLRSSGIYPVIRGTMLELDKSTGILYTTGYIPYYETYPGVHIPQPIEVNIYEGESTLRKVCSEILGLTKMNFNNCNYFDSLPITIRFAQKVGEIAQYIEDEENSPNRYYFYM
ncbi:MAG: hypothetical protein ACFB15_20715 [Cyclobacteriaceae bacterium]